jgi:tetrahydromethanopterin S-methyltransferase subunit G
MIDDMQKDAEKCTIICPTSHYEMNKIRNRLDTGSKKMDEIYNSIKKNRRYDIAILSISIIGFVINFFYKIMG